MITLTFKNEANESSIKVCMAPVISIWCDESCISCRRKGERTYPPYPYCTCMKSIWSEFHIAAYIPVKRTDWHRRVTVMNDTLSTSEECTFICRDFKFIIPVLILSCGAVWLQVPYYHSWACKAGALHKHLPSLVSLIWISLKEIEKKHLNLHLCGGPCSLPQAPRTWCM